jgi:hypothetical protein
MDGRKVKKNFFDKSFWKTSFFGSPEKLQKYSCFAAPHYNNQAAAVVDYIIFKFDNFSMESVIYQ